MGSEQGLPLVRDGGQAGSASAALPLTAAQWLWSRNAPVVTGTAEAWRTAWERRDSGSGVGQDGSQMCAWRGDSSPRAARCPVGTLVELVRTRGTSWVKPLWSTWAVGKNKRHINAPSDNTASHFSPGRKKRGEACLKPCIRARNCLKVLQTQPSTLAEQCVVALHGVLGIVHPSPCRG